MKSFEDRQKIFEISFLSKGTIYSEKMFERFWADLNVRLALFLTHFLLGGVQEPREVAKNVNNGFHNMEPRIFIFKN